jgi:Na+/H+-translocating membrane pyrophosphatase
MTCAWPCNPMIKIANIVAIMLIPLIVSIHG